MYREQEALAGRRMAKPSAESLDYGIDAATDVVRLA
jgi:hypothetical protein